MGKKEKRPQKPQRRCVFCNQNGLSKEHIWSDWLEDHLPTNPHHDWWARENSVDANSGEPVFNSTKDREQGALNSLRVRVVCVDCNSGWMSRIVESAQPAVARMLSGEAVTLDRSEMTAIATWVTLATMMREYLLRGQPVAPSIPNDDLAYLMNHNTPPPSWVVSLGKYVGTQRGVMMHDRHRCYRRVLKKITKREVEKKLLFQVTTYNLKSVLFQTFCTREPFPMRSYKFGMQFLEMQPIWPSDSETVQWPVGGLDDQQTHFLANAFYHTAMRELGHERLH